MSARIIGRMCGRYVRRSDKQRIAEHFRIDPTTLPDLEPSYNIAPQTFQPIVRVNRHTGEREIVMMRWGLVPFWILSANSGRTEVTKACLLEKTARIRCVMLDRPK
jgi:putative SOS response-associated peptidase YedK